MSKPDYFAKNNLIIRGYTVGNAIKKPIDENYNPTLDDLRYSAISTMYKAVDELSTNLAREYSLSKMEVLKLIRTHIFSCDKDQLRDLHVLYHIKGPKEFVESIIYLYNGKPGKTKRNRRTTGINE